jgi:hypothetical protein
MATYNGLPVYKIKINTALDSNEGIDFISLVSSPAIETNFVKLASANLVRVSFDKPKQMLYGAILIPDQLIYRSDPKMGEYYVTFSKEEIELIVRKFQAQKKTVNINYQHQNDSQIKECVVQEIWLTGKKDKSQDFGFDLPEGSAMAGTYIGNSKFWAEEVESGNVLGYSIEGWLDMELKKQIKHKLMESKTDKGEILKTPAEGWVVGVDATIVAADGTETPAEGDYTLDNGTVIKCVAGKVTEIVEADAAMSTEEIAALNEVFSALLTPLNEKIAALELKLSTTPATTSATDKSDNEEVKKVNPLQVTMSRINKIKINLKNK